MPTQSASGILMKTPPRMTRPVLPIHRPCTPGPARTDHPGRPATTGGFDGTRGPHTRWADMDFGVFFTSSLGSPRIKAAPRQRRISIRLGKDKKHAIAFDTDLLRVSFGWSGDFVKIYNGREGLAQHPDVAGDVKFRTDALPGWSKPMVGRGLCIICRRQRILPIRVPTNLGRCRRIGQNTKDFMFMAIR